MEKGKLVSQRESRIINPFRVYLLFFVLGALYTWPLVEYLFEGIPYYRNPGPLHFVRKLAPGDHLQIYYHLGLLKEAALGHIEWFSNPLEFAANVNEQSIDTYSLPLSVIYLLFSFVSSPFAYNMYVLITLALGGLAMYLWAVEVTGSKLGGLFAAFVFSFIPLRLAELLGGHPAGFAIFLFPLTLYFFDVAIRKRSFAHSALAGLSIFILSLQYIYFCYYLFMLLIPYIPWRLFPIVKGWIKNRGEAKGDIKKMALAGAPFATGCFGAIWWMLYYKTSSVEQATFGGGRSLGEVSLYSSRISTMWDPQLIWNVYIGPPALIILLCFFYGLVVSQKKEKNKWEILFFSSVFFVAYILAFGTTVDKHFPLFSFFYNNFPFFNYSRVPSKIMVIAIPVMCVLIAGFIGWVGRLEKPRALFGYFAVAIFLATAVNYHPKAIGITLLDEGNALYKRLSDDAKGSLVLNVPIWPGESTWESIYQYYALQSGVPMINGYSPVVSKKHIDEIFWPLFTINSGDLSEAQVDLLRRLNVGHVIFHEEAYPTKVSAYPSSLALRRLLASPYLELVKRAEPLWLFKIVENETPKEARQVTSPIGVLYQAERLHRINGKAVMDEDAINGAALMGALEKGEVKGKILNSGPYATFPSGRYKASFRVKVADNSCHENVLSLNVSGASGRINLASVTLKCSDFKSPGKYQNVTLEYNLAPGKAWQIEYRSFVLGHTPVYIDSVYIRFADQDDNDFEYEAEHFYHTGRVVTDETASGGKAMEGTGEGFRLNGPGRWFDAGSYRALFKVKTGHTPMDEPFVKVDVFSLSRYEIIAERLIMRNEAPEDNVYHDLPLDFRLTKPDVLEFRLYYKGSDVLWVDKITVEPLKAN
ncbi:hypothetical protein MNBD_NITROSPINAE02-1974 [hydrothermal vent metagenome]|uniref:Uncharacterized protein n=1 Tax=hydrothermal vent metagenome TaxID=652676 RepID=A0A3B1C565_9ZZZZ